MDETLILIAKNKIKDQALTSQEANNKIKKFDEDYPLLLQWCYFNLHNLTANESRTFVLEKIQNIVDYKFYMISLNSRDDLIAEFFLSIFKDQNYLDTSLLNLISGIQARLIKNLFPSEWPTAFNPEDELSVMNFPDPVFYNFLKSFGPIARINKKIVNFMIEDEFSLNNLLNRISESTVNGSSDAKESYLNCFKWIDFHILINCPCIIFILDDFSQVPNPEIALSVLSTIFKQDSISIDERIKSIEDFTLFKRFTKYLKTFTVISLDFFNSFINLICNIFLPLKDNEYSKSFIQIFTTIFTRLITTKTKDDNYRLNDLFNEMIINGIIDYQSLKEIYYPMLISSLENLKDDFDLNLSLLFDLFFRSIDDKSILVSEIRSFLTELMQTIQNTPEEQSKFKYFYYILNEFLHFVQKNRPKVIISEILLFFSFILDTKPTQELLEDQYYINSIKAYTNIFIKSSLYFESKRFRNISIKASQIFDLLFQCTTLGTDVFMDLMYQLTLFSSNITELGNIDDIIIFFISSLNINLINIAKKLLECAPDENIGMIKNRSIENIISRNPISFTSYDVRVLNYLFNQNENQSNEFSGFLFVSPENNQAYEFFSQIFISNAKSSETEEEEENQSQNIFETIDDFFEYIKMLVFLFGYRSYQFYANEIFARPEAHNISVLTSILTILSTKFRPADIEKLQVIPEIEETIKFMIEYGQNSIKDLFAVVERDLKNSNEEPSQEMKDFSLFYSEFTRYIIPFIPVVPQEIFMQILLIFENVFKYPILSSEAYQIFFSFLTKNNDVSLFEDVYPNTVYLLVQIISQPPIFATDFKNSAIEIFTFHHKIFQKNIEWGLSIIAPAADVLNTVQMKFDVYVRLMKSDKDQFCTELGKIINCYFRKQ